MLMRRPARASAASAPWHVLPCSPLLLLRGPSRFLRDDRSFSFIAHATPSSSPHDPPPDSDDEPGRRVAMAMAASWGKKAAPSLPAPMTKTAAAPTTKKTTARGAVEAGDSGPTTADRLSRAIAASARAAALSSQLRAAHDRLGSATPRALVASIAALAAAADDLDGPASGARTGTLEFFSYALPSSPFLQAWRGAVRAALSRMTKKQLADALYSLGRLPYYAPAPLPIGFGTPRYARPLAASEPEEWEKLLEEAAAAWLALPAHEEEQEEEEETGSTPARALEARFLLGLALSKRWCGLRVGDAWLASREADERLQRALSELPTGQGAKTAATAAATATTTATTTLSPAARLAAALLQVRGAPPLLLARAFFDETAGAAAEGAAWPASWAAGRRPSTLGSTIAARAGANADAAELPPTPTQTQTPTPTPAPMPMPAADADDGEEDLPPPTQPPTLSSTLVHAKPSPAPSSPPSALCAALSPRQLQRAARGLVYLGFVPGDAWLRALASASRCALGCGSLDARELAALRDALRFFAAERHGGTSGGGGGGAASAAAFAGGEREPGDRTGLAEAVAVLDEWCVGGSGAF